MDARELFRFAPGYSVDEFPTQLDWSAWPGAAGGLQGAVEMCNNNGACRKLEGGVMCPSFRVTGDEKTVHVAGPTHFGWPCLASWDQKRWPVMTWPTR